MEEKVGSFIKEKDGTVRPNDKDEAMVERERIKQLPASQNAQEVTDAAG